VKEERSMACSKTIICETLEESEAAMRALGAKFVRMQVPVPCELHIRMERIRRRIDWKAVAIEAFERKLVELEK
jgi:hypothetical protein